MEKCVNYAINLRYFEIINALNKIRYHQIIMDKIYK